MVVLISLPLPLLFAPQGAPLATTPPAMPRPPRDVVPERKGPRQYRDGLSPIAMMLHA